VSRNLLEEVSFPPETLERVIHSVTRGGKGIKVTSHRTDQLAITAATQTLGGAVQQTAEEKAAERGLSDVERKLRGARASLPYAGPVIELGCSVTLEDGTVVRPAFSVGGKVPGTIPTERIADVEALALMQDVMRCSGYDSPEVEQVSFHGEGGPGGDAGALPVEADAPAASEVGVPSDAEPAPAG